MLERPLINVKYGPVHLEPINPAPQEPKTRPVSKRIAETLGLVSMLLVNLAMIGGVIAITTLALRELPRRYVVIESFNLPSVLEDQGYSGFVASHLLWDAISNIYKESGTEKAEALLTTSESQFDIVEPGTGVSLQSITKLIRATLNLPLTTIAGDVICASPECNVDDVRLRLRITINGRLIIRDVHTDDSAEQQAHVEMRDRFENAAEDVLRVVDPYVLAWYYYNYTGQTKFGLSIAQQMIEDGHHDRAWAANLLGYDRVVNGRPSQAIPYFQTAVTFARKDGMEHFAVPHEHWGNALTDLGRYDEAAKEFERSVELDQNRIGAWLGWANSLVELGKTDDAYNMYQSVTEVAPDDARPWINWGAVLASNGDHEDALQKYQKAQDADPSFSTAIANWGNSLAAEKHLDEAIVKFRHAVALRPESAGALYGWGATLARDNRHDEALVQYQRAIELRPPNALPLRGYAYSLSQLERHKEAVDAFTRAGDFNPAITPLFQGWAHRLRHWRTDENAIEGYLYAQDLDLDYPEYWTSWAESLIAVGQYGEAIQKSTEALKRSADYVPAAKTWTSALSDLLAQDETLKCRRAEEHIPGFLKAVGNLLPDDGEVQQIQAQLAGCS